MQPVGINVVGYITGNLGLGVLARDLVRMLVSRGHAVAAFDLDAGLNRSGVVTDLEVQLVNSVEELPHEFTIWVFGADRLAHYALEILDSNRMRQRVNVAYVWWELPDIPMLWLRASEAFDALLVGSEFVREMWAMQVHSIPVIVAPVPIILPSDVGPDRPLFRLPTDRFLVFTGFEPASDPARKNPFAAIAAFQSAFVGIEDAGLIIKLNNAKSDRRVIEQIEALRRKAQDDARILVIEERLPYDKLLSLYASCDAAISLHRSEGLGLMPMEMMSVGRPVVATGWSGNLTYMDHANACLVRYSMVPVDNSSIHYAQEVTGVASRWAEPDIAHAAQWLRQLYDDVGFRQALGAAAARDIKARNARVASARFVDELMGAMRCRSRRDAESASRLRQTIFLLMRQWRLKHLTPAQRATHAVRTAFDRHIGWRLKSDADRDDGRVQG